MLVAGAGGGDRQLFGDWQLSWHVAGALMACGGCWWGRHAAIGLRMAYALMLPGGRRATGRWRDGW